MSETSFDQEKFTRMLSRVSEALSGTLVMQMCFIGDRLGLFKDLAERGPATSDQFAERNGIVARYALEWLSAMVAAQYLDYDPTGRIFRMPKEHAPVLAEEGSAKFMSGIFQMLPALQTGAPQIIEAFKEGGGVSKEHFDDNYWTGMERCTGRWYEHHLLPDWIGLLPDLKAKLDRGGRVADIGCGRGQALIKLAQAFPNARFEGFDVFAPSIGRAEANAADAAVTDRVRFQRKDAAEALDGTYDLVICVDALHEFPNIPATLTSIRNALGPDGVFLLHEVNVGEKLEDNISPRGAMFYSVSVLYCLSENLRSRGEGLGRLGLHEKKVRELCSSADLGRVRRLWEDPVDVVYEIRR